MSGGVLRAFTPVLSLFLVLFFSGCSEPRDEAKARLRGVNVAQLRFEVGRVLKNLHSGRGPEFIALKPAFWPTAFRQLHPVRIGCYRDGLAFVFAGEASNESGLHVQPPGMDRMPKAALTKYERLQEGIFWFETSK
jgi:hypothetical protein